jgi:predicted nucleotidyltransferase
MQTVTTEMEEKNIPIATTVEELIREPETNTKDMIGWVDKSTPQNNLGLWRSLNVHQSYQENETDNLNSSSKSDATLPSTSSKSSSFASTACSSSLFTYNCLPLIFFPVADSLNGKKSPYKKRSPIKNSHCGHPKNLGFIELGEDSESSSGFTNSTDDNLSTNGSTDSGSSTSQSDALSDYSNDAELLKHSRNGARPFIGLAEADALDLNINRPARNSSHFNDHRTSNGNVRYNTNNHHDQFFPQGSTPWKEADHQYSRGVIGLHQEIQDFHDYIQPTTAEIELRNHVIQKLEYVVKKRWPLATVTVFGSFRTGLILPTSDLDIIITGKWRRFPLFTVAEELIRAKVTKEKNTTVIPYATVPIVKYIDEETNIKVDISFNVKDGLAAFALVNVSLFFCLQKNGHLSCSLFSLSHSLSLYFDA